MFHRDLAEDVVIPDRNRRGITLDSKSFRIVVEQSPISCRGSNASSGQIKVQSGPSAGRFVGDLAEKRTEVRE
jgi:hypothetical protein